jgi:hypothetical protein
MIILAGNAMEIVNMDRDEIGIWDHIAVFYGPW